MSTSGPKAAGSSHTEATADARPEQRSYALLSPIQMRVAYVSGSFGFGFQSMVSFLVPLRAQELGASLEMIGLIVGAGALVPALLSVPAGALADRIGSRRAYVLGTAVSSVIALSVGLISSYWIMLVLQLLLGAGRGVAWVASQTYITGVGAPADRAQIMGRFSFSTNAGTFFAPLLAGTIAQLVGFQTSFVLLAGIGVFYTLLGVVLPEVRSKVAVGGHGNAQAGGFDVALGLVRIRGIQVALLLTVTRLWIWSTWSAFFPLFLLERGFSPAVIGTVLASSAVAATSITLASGMLSRRMSHEVATAVALGIGALGVALAPQLAFMPFVYLPTFLIGTGSGVSLPLLMAIMSDTSPPHQRGVALGLRTSVNQAASTVAPIALGSVITSVGMATAFALSAAFSWTVLGAALALYAIDRRKSRSLPG